MKRCMFFLLLTMLFCKAADSDPNENWARAMQDMSIRKKIKAFFDRVDLQGKQIIAIPDEDKLYSTVVELYLNDNEITCIPQELNMPRLLKLCLRNNQIGKVDPTAIFASFPRIVKLDLRGNPLKNIEDIKKKFHECQERRLQEEKKVEKEIEEEFGDPMIDGWRLSSGFHYTPFTVKLP